MSCLDDGKTRKKQAKLRGPGTRGKPTPKGAGKGQGSPLKTGKGTRQFGPSENFLSSGFSRG